MVKDIYMTLAFVLGCTLVTIVAWFLVALLVEMVKRTIEAIKKGVRRDDN